MIPETPPDLESIRARLEAFLREASGTEHVVSGVRLLAGGASRAAYAFDLRAPGETANAGFVLRLDLGGKIYASALSRAQEFRVLRAALAGGCPVPGVDWLCEDERVLGRDFFILERLEGETIGRRIVSLQELAEARRELPAQMARALAKIHALDVAALVELPRPASVGPSGEPNAFATALERAREELDRVEEPHPAIELGLAWLASRVPRIDEHVVVHGDFRIGNMMVDRKGLVGVLDWEFAAIGDRYEDLAWPFVRDWRFGNDRCRFGGLDDGESFLRAYEEVAGHRVDRDRLALWEVLGNLRWALGCATQACRHLRGEEPSVELASLGRRAAEMELEALLRIEEIEKGSALPIVVSPGEDSEPARESVHDAPALDALLESVQSFLGTEIAPFARSDPRVRFRSLVAANVLSIVRREISDGAGAETCSRPALASALGCEGSVARLLAECARRLRDGSLRGEVGETIWLAVRDTVLEKLRVANPAFLERTAELRKPS